MNNVWISIAYGASCARTPTRVPLSHLFHGYNTLRTTRTVSANHVRLPARCSFSTSSKWLATKKKMSHKPFPSPKKTSIPDRFPSVATTPTAQASVTAIAPVDTTQAEKKEALTWRDYDPEGGMPLSQGELSIEQIHKVLGSSVDKDTGNYVLNLMNWRRQSGALIDIGIDVPSWSGISREQALWALDYVRDLDPDFDEQAAGHQWIDEETERQRLKIQDRGVRLGLYKARPETLPEEEEPENLQGTEDGRKRTGESALVQQRQQREAEWEAEQARLAIVAEQKETAAVQAQRGPLELSGGVQPSAALVRHDPMASALAEQRQRTEEWRKRWEDKATISQSQEIPQMGLLARLGPAFLVLLSSTAAAWLFYSAYTPPPTSARMWPDIPPSIATVSAVTAVLVLSAIACRLPPFWPFVTRFLTIVPAYPHAASIIGAVFRHDRLQHLASNIIVLWLVGPTLHEDVGRGGFLAILLASAAFGGFASLTYEVLTKSWSSYVFGASNAILGLFAATCTIQPNRTIHAFGYDIPFAAWIFLALNLSAETIGLLAGFGPTLGIDFAGHIGGQVCGLVVALYFRGFARENHNSHHSTEHSTSTTVLSE